MEYSIPRICDNHLFQYLISDVFLEQKILFAEKLNHAIIRIASKDIEVHQDVELEKNQRYELLEKIKNSAGFSIEKIQIGYIIKVHNNYNETKTKTIIEYNRSSSGFIDKIKITDDHNSDKNLLAFIEIRQQLDKVSYHHIDEKNNAPLYTDVLSRLEGLSAALIQDLHKQQISSAKEKENYRDEQEKKYINKTQQRLEELENEFNNKNNDLEQREKRLIDADNTTARRQVRNDLITSITPRAERFSFSSSINDNIKLISIICLILASFGFFVSFTSYIEITSGKQDNNSTLWFHYIKSFSGGAVFLTSLTYLIRWLNQWTNRVANTELDYQKFERDLNRSHLAIEMCLEWKDKKDEPIPEILLQAMTSGLFIKEDESNKFNDSHPVDQLAAALVKSADKLEIPIGTAIATTSGKNLKKEKLTP